MLPGAGQLYARRPWRAAAFFAPMAPLAAVALIGYRRGTFGIVELAVQPNVLRGLIAADIAVLGWRAWSVIDAYLIAAERQYRTDPSKVVLVVVLVALAVPHLVAGAYAGRGIDLIESVFADDGNTDGDTRQPVNITEIDPDDPVDPQLFGDLYAPIEHSTRNMIFRRGVGDPDAIAALADILNPPSVVNPHLPEFEERVNPGRLTILLVGGDAGPGRSGLRTDTMMVATMDMETGKAAIFGLPRNFKGVPLPRKFHDVFIDDELAAIEATWSDENQDGIPDQWVDLDGDLVPDEPVFESCNCYMEMLNTVHGRTEGWTSSYPDSPDPGMSALRDVIEELLDLDIDYFVLVDMAAFVRGIDAIGGVDVMVEKPLHVTVSAPWEGSPKASVSVEPGLNHLDGLQALAYSRWRIGSSDYARMERQRCLVRAAVAQAHPANLLWRFPDIASVIEDYVVTDIPRNFLPDLVRVAGTVDFNDIATVGFVPPTYIDGRVQGYPFPDVDRIRNKVRQVLADGAAAQSSTGESECGT
jgi:LCP family protein required for cell wall assembly